MNEYRIRKARPIAAEMRVPGDKSISHRAVLLAALANGPSVITGFLPAAECLCTINACRALGVTAPVTSPTYTIGHRYEGAPDVSHLDLYRFTGVSAAEWGDLEPYFDDAIVFVEWPEAGAAVLPPLRASVRLEHQGETTRRVVIEGNVRFGR